MIEKIMKAVKSSNKRRGRNITIGAVIGFLLSCTAVMGATEDKYLYIKEGQNGIEFSTNSKTESDGDWSGENLYEDAGNIWDKDTETKTYTNNITLSSSTVNGKDGNNDISYGFRLSGDLTGVNFKNNGSIIGIMGIGDANINGYGIYNSATMGNIENKGIISGTGASTGYRDINGYGIYNNSGKIGDITNTGIISSTGTGKGTCYGYGIYNNSGTIENIENIGIISSTGFFYDPGRNGTGIGYGIYNLGKIGDITNTGVISATSTGSGSGYASSYGIHNRIYNKSSGTIENIENKGVISVTGSGTAWDAGNGNGYGDIIIQVKLEI